MSEHDERHRLPWRWLSLAVLGLCVLLVAVMFLAWGRTTVGVILAGALPVVLVVGVLAALVHPRHHPFVRAALVAALLLPNAPLLDYVVPDRSGPASSPASGEALRVVTLNTASAGMADGEITRLAADADLVTLQEWPAHRVAGLLEALGPSWTLAADDHDDYIGAQVLVLVRDTWQVAATGPVPDAMPPATALTLTKGGHDVRVVGTRLENPAFVPAITLWGDGLDALEAWTTAGPGPTVVLGDLNATPSAVTFRRFLHRSGLTGCTDQLGRGFPGTWGRGEEPAWAPVPIDHVLVRDARCTDLSIRPVPGTDHRALLATVVVS